MMRGRLRLVIAVVALLAVAGLSACRASPAVAAYVGDLEISEEQVTGLVTDVRTSFESELETELQGLADRLTEEQLADFRTRGADEIDTRLEGIRSQVVEMMILTEAGRRHAEANGLTIPPPDPAPLAADLRLDEDHPYVSLFAEFISVMGTLSANSTPGQPSEADQREVFENLRVDGQQLPQPFEEVQRFLTAEALGSAVGLRDLLVQVVGEAEVTVNPRYQLVYRVPVQLGQADSWLGVPIGGSSPVVESD
jgi:hypothetical protein